LEVTAVVGLIVGMIKGLIEGITGGLVAGFETLFIAEGGGITALATWAILGIGMGLVMGITAKVMRKI